MTGKYDDWKSTEIIIYVIGTSIEPAAEEYILFNRSHVFK